MSCEKQDLLLIRGVDKTLRVTVSDEDGDAVDLTGATVYFRVKVDISDASAVIEKVSTDVAEIEINADPTTGLADIYLIPGDTSSLTLVPHVYDVWVTLANGKSYAVVEPSAFRLERAVTELP